MPWASGRGRRVTTSSPLGTVPRLDPPAVLFDDAAGDREAETGAAVIGRKVRLEDPPQHPRLDPGPRVGDPDPGRGGVAGELELHPAAPGVGAQRILQQIAHRPAEELPVEPRGELREIADQVDRPARIASRYAAVSSSIAATRSPGTSTALGIRL